MWTYCNFIQIVLIPQASQSIKHNVGLFGAQPTASIFGTKRTVDITPAAGFSFSAAFAPAHSQVSAMIKRFPFCLPRQGRSLRYLHKTFESNLSLEYVVHSGLWLHFTWREVLEAACRQTRSALAGNWLFVVPREVDSPVMSCWDQGSDQSCKCLYLAIEEVGLYILLSWLASVLWLSAFPTSGQKPWRSQCLNYRIPFGSASIAS